jgi:hypothetical protein
MTTQTFAFDFGNVISCREFGVGIHVPVFNATRVIRRITDSFGADNCYIVSKVREAGEEKIKKWLQHSEFEYLTRFNMDNLRFCRERADKGPICEALGITTLIDDRPDVHLACSSVANRFLFRPSAQDMKHHDIKSLVSQAGVKLVQSWSEVETHIFEGQ